MPDAQITFADFFGNIGLPEIDTDKTDKNTEMPVPVVTVSDSDIATAKLLSVTVTAEPIEVTPETQKPVETETVCSDGGEKVALKATRKKEKTESKSVSIETDAESVKNTEETVKETEEEVPENFDFRNLYEKGDLIYLVRLGTVRKLKIRSIYEKNMIGCYETGECCCVTAKEHQQIFHNNIDAKIYQEQEEERDR